MCRGRVSARYPPAVARARSERLSLSGSEGEALVETQNINLSLALLGDVLSAVSRNAVITTAHQREAAEGQKSPPPGAKATLAPVPYRNSKLTHLLKVRSPTSSRVYRERTT